MQHEIFRITTTHGGVLNKSTLEVMCSRIDGYSVSGGNLTMFVNGAEVTVDPAASVFDRITITDDAGVSSERSERARNFSQFWGWLEFCIRHPERSRGATE